MTEPPPIARLWQPYAPLEFKVRCERRLHRIRIDERGRLILVDHDLEFEALAQALGGDEMRCPKVVDLFKNAVKYGSAGALPDKAKPHVWALRARKEDRRAWAAERQTLVWGSSFLASAGAAPNPGLHGTPKPLEPIHWQTQRSKDAYLVRYLRRRLAESRLATATPKGAEPYTTPHAIQVQVQVVQQLPPEQQLQVHGRQGFGPRTSLRGTLYVHEHWWRRVHLAGLDVVDGRLVLDAPSLPGTAPGVLYSFAGMTPRARKRANRQKQTEPVLQLPLPDVVGETRTATVCVLSDPRPAAYPSDRWQLKFDTRWFEAVAERGAPWRLVKPVESWRVPTH
jgi:hypothetical protein